MKVTEQITATSLTSQVQQWLRQPTAVSLLHRFDHALNLIDAHGHIISVVQPSIGPGPFSIVVDEERPFPTTITPATPVQKSSHTLHIGPLHINLRPARLWQPTPRWALLREQQNEWLSLLPELETAVSQNQARLTEGSPAPFARQFYTATRAVRVALAQLDAAGLETAVAQLAGLGPGFTPAGDDFLLGMLLGLWATRSEEVTVRLAELVLETAVPRTTQLSAAWLQAAGRGEAWQPWHSLVDALSAGLDWQLPVQRILNQGATSGIAALQGFMTAVSKTSTR
ncbi:MAG: DUF2877 domain-containing protein [Ardenticatenaceae bacterium]|nr:DUF2877 domain-containing protein [Ardenticatenaceae bacterium]